MTIRNLTTNTPTLAAADAAHLALLAAQSHGTEAEIQVAYATWIALHNAAREERLAAQAEEEPVQFLTYCNLCGDEFYSNGSEEPCADCLQEARNIALALASDPEQIEEEPTVTAADAALIAANITVATAERALLDLIYRRDALIIAGEPTEEIEREMAIASKALELERFNRDNIAVDIAWRKDFATCDRCGAVLMGLEMRGATCNECLSKGEPTEPADDAPGDEGEPMSEYTARLLERLIGAGLVPEDRRTDAEVEVARMRADAEAERERTYDLRDDWAEEMQLRAVSA